jgi:hypothetical protein
MNKKTIALKLPFILCAMSTMFISSAQASDLSEAIDFVTQAFKSCSALRPVDLRKAIDIDDNRGTHWQKAAIPVIYIDPDTKTMEVEESFVSSTFHGKPLWWQKNPPYSRSTNFALSDLEKAESDSNYLKISCSGVACINFVDTRSWNKGQGKDGKEFYELCDDDMAKRVAHALSDAIKLSGGGKKSKY